MSVKIYEGRRFRCKNIKKFFDTAIHIKRGMENVFDESYRKIFVNLYTRKLDHAVIDNALTKKSDIFYEVHSEWIADLTESRRVTERNIPYDMECSVCFYYYRGYVYLIPFVDYPTPEYFGVFDSIEGMEEFGYWDNTDHSDKFTNKQWNARGKLWDRLIGTTFDKNAVMFASGKDILDYKLKYFKMRDHDLAPLVSIMEKRVDTLLFDYAANQISGECGIFQKFDKVKAWKNDESNREEIDRVKAEYAAKLIPPEEMFDFFVKEN